MIPTKPIIVFGTGRSGTTIFHRMLSEHHNLVWLSQLCKKHPDKPFYNNLLMKSLDYPLLESMLRRKYHPLECYPFWEYYSKGFSTPYRDLFASDVSIKQKKNIVKIMSKMTTKQRNRLLLKITGWPRIGFLSEVFNDAKFINVIRDGRSVANSLLNVKFWNGWGGPEKWRFGPLSNKYKEEWRSYNYSFIVLAAIQWKILMDAAEKTKSHLDDSNLLEIKYEKLCSNPISVFKDVTMFCELEWNKNFEKKLKKYNLRNTNTKFKNQLNPQQQKELELVLNTHLIKYGYS